ncbi:MAG TPA: hypothetical protein PKB02_15430 [Anaerohalosphaeraceae bacterium]|nr:hypothetical protein [Anaerohalosphaeraceae bacterium]
MAESPSHKLGQWIGFLVEAIVKSQIEPFCKKHKYYLDCQSNNRPARKGKKVAWVDNYGNTHDLDFVIEKDGTQKKTGTPIGFIEVAWRRYTKHSRNKVQEIQGAILPLVEKHKWNNPFVGVVLAGDFTEGAIKQLKSLGFAVLYLPYNSIIAAFKKENINIAFDESTPDSEFKKHVINLEKCPSAKIHKIKRNLLGIHRKAIKEFMRSLEQKLSKVIDKVIIVPLYGNANEFTSIKQAVTFIEQYKENRHIGEFKKFEVYVRFSNHDKIEAEFSNKQALREFLQYLSTAFVAG